MALLSPSLPSELVEEILYRVPIKSILRFKSISKKWNTLFNDKRFIYNHFGLSHHKGFIRGNHNSIQHFDFETKAFSCLKIPQEFHLHTIESTHCDGLLLCDCFTRTLIRKLAIWNPFLRRVKWIKPSKSDSYNVTDVFGFGYDNVSRENYKILRISNKRVVDDQDAKSKKNVEIYEFNTNLWRNVDSVVECIPPRRSVSMNGNMYWIAQSFEENEFSIQSFDFSTETFKTICCVPKGIESSEHSLALSGFGEDRFCLFRQHKHLKKIEVWVTNKLTDDDGVISWSKRFDVIRPHLPLYKPAYRSCLPIHFIHKTNEVMLWCEKEDYKRKCLQDNVYEMSQKGEMTKLGEIRGKLWYHNGYKCCHVYVPSLVPVPEC